MKRTILVAIVCVIALWTPRPSAQAVRGAGGGRGAGAAAPAGGNGGDAGAASVLGPDGSFGTFAPWVGDANYQRGFRVRQEMDNPNQKFYNTAVQKLFDGKQLFSWTQSRPDSEQYCVMAPHYDFVWIDMQHSTLNFSDVEKMLAACPRVGVPIVRVPDVTYMNLQRAEDLGALGVIVPQVEDGVMAMQAGNITKYPPFGVRSCCSGQAPGLWGALGINYRNTINDNMLVIVMLESPNAVARAYQIAAQPGVGVVITGNGDMANTSGYQPSDPRYQDLILKTHDAAMRAGKFFGTAANTYAKGTPISKDAQFFQNGPSMDGFTPPARGGAAGGRGAGQQP